MQRVHRHQLPIVLTLAVFLMATAWGAADARPYEGFQSGAAGQFDRNVCVASGEPDQPWVAPRDGSIKARLLGNQGGSDLRSGSGLAAIWAQLRVWMLR